MRPTEELKQEHQAILRMIAVLRGVSTRLETGTGPSTRGDLPQIVDFIRIFADKCHHGKEEDLLFPAMEAAGIPRQGGPIGVMLAEHAVGREFVAGMAAAAEAYRGGDAQAGGTFAEKAVGYGNLLTPHIGKEDNILYPMADARLTEDQQRALMEGFERVERKVIGAGRHEAFHALLDRLEMTYAGS